MLTNKNALSVFIGIGLCLLLWWLASLRFSSFIVPSPTETAIALVGLVADPVFWRATLVPTLFRAIAGGAVAAMIGITLGLAAGHSPFVNGILETPRLFLSAMPAPVFVILALLWVGAQNATIILTVAVMLIPLFFVATRDGLSGCDAALLEMARVYRFGWIRKSRHILLPAVTVSLLPATRVAIANGLRLTILAEILVVTGGVGEQISLARQYLETEKLFALVLILVTLIAAIEASLWPWIPGRERNK